MDLDELLEDRRTAERDDSEHEDGGDPGRKSSTKRKRQRRNSGGSQGSAQPSPNCQIHEERQEESEGGGRNTQQPVNWYGFESLVNQRQDPSLVQEDHQARFYMDYRKVADEFDNEFLKKYNEDLNTTLIFAGLFSAVTSAFIIEVDSQLQPDPGDETAALLRVLIYEINNAAFGGNIPTVPQWTGPPPTMVHVQAILFASLVASLLSAFLAMLGKQWLNRYESADMRGSAVERGQNRQRKLDGIVAWYFNHVMESLPLMLQAALLLLGCALSRYLWDISITVASVVIGVTSCGLVFYLFIIVAGTVSESCPYQLPGSQILRHLGPQVWRAIHSVRPMIGSLLSIIGPVLRNTLKQSRTVSAVAWSAGAHDPWWSRSKIIPFLWDLILKVPLGLAFDAYLLGRTTTRALFTLLVEAYSAIRNPNIKLQGLYSTMDQQTTPSHFRCISWTLQTSLDKPIHLTALEHFCTMTDLPGLDPILVMDCFNVFAGCVSLSDNELVVMQGLGQLAAVSAGCLFHIINHLWATDPTSGILVDLCRRYTRLFPLETRLTNLPFHHTIMIVHGFAHGSWNRYRFEWDDYRPFGQDRVPFAQHMVEVAQVEYQRMEHRKVPRWILRFALHSLFLDPPPPASVVADCLTIVAIDLDCDISNVVALDESERVEQILSLITQKFRTVDHLRHKHKAVATIFLYAVRAKQYGQQEMVDTILCAVRDDRSLLKWPEMITHLNTLFDESSPPSLNQTISSVSPYVPWGTDEFNSKKAVAKWAAVALVVPYSEEVGRDTIDTLLQVSCTYSLLPHIWALFKKRPSLPPVCRGRSLGSYDAVIRHVRGLGDIELLKSYLLLIWSEWDSIFWDEDFTEMENSIREDFGGIEMWCHRDDLIKHLDHVQAQLDRGLEYFKQHDQRTNKFDITTRKEDYGDLKKLLLEVDKRAMELLTRSHATFACALPLPCP